MKLFNVEKFWKTVGEEESSLTQLAKKFKISRNTLHNISSGRTSPSKKVIIYIAQVTPMTAKEFVAIFFPTIKFKEEP